MPLDDLRAELRKLPESLETLEITTNGAQRLFLFDAYGEDGTIINDQLGYRTDPPVVKEVKHFFPRLTTLQLPTTPPIAPPSLIHWKSEDENASMSHLTRFPDTLECYDAVLHLESDCASDASLWQGAPKLLTYLVAQLHGSDDLRTLEAIPRQLRHCNLQLPGHNGAFTAPLMRSMPPHSLFIYIYALDVHSFGPLPWTRELPVCLETMLIWNRYAEVCFTEELINALPRTLTKIAGKVAYDWTSIAMGGVAGTLQWPPKLNELESTAEIPGEVLRFLPKSVRRVTFGWDEEGSLDTAELPPSIEHLALASSDASSNFIAFHGLPLPISLTHLSLKGAKETGRLSTSSIALLPQTLRTLEFMFESDLAEAAEEGNPIRAPLLPAHLENLAIDVWAWSWFPRLPRSLKKLAIAWMLSSTEEMYEDCEQDYFRPLPTSLTELSLNSAEELPELSARSFSTLTRLKVLSIRGLGYVNSGFLRTVSRSLHTLQVTLETFEPENGPLLLLPYLTTLDLGPRVDIHVMHIINNWPPATDLFNPYVETRRRIARQNALLYPDPRIRSDVSQ